MKPCSINRSLQHLALVLFLCAACLISSIHAFQFYSTPDNEFNDDLLIQNVVEKECTKYCNTAPYPVFCERCRNSVESKLTGKRNHLITRSSNQDNSMCGCCAHSRGLQTYCCERCSNSNSSG